MASLIFGSLCRKYCSIYIWPTAWSSGMHCARTRLPLELFGNPVHRLPVLVAGHLCGYRHEAVVKRSPSPIHLRVGGHAT